MRGLWDHTDLSLISAPLLRCCVASGKLFNLSVPHVLSFVNDMGLNRNDFMVQMLGKMLRIK